MAESPRVALLARPGQACERLRAALHEAGGQIVIEADPATIDPQALRIAAVETVLVALDPAVEDALERFDEVLGDRAIEVIFDEADLAARREGWDAARWVRHLSAKLHRHDDVLPPGREPDAEPLPVPGKPEAPEARHAQTDLTGFLAEADDVAAQVPREPAIGASVEFALPGAIETAEAIETVAFHGLDIDMPELAMTDVVAMPDVAFELADIVDVQLPEVAEGQAIELEGAERKVAEVELEAETAGASYGAISFTDDLDDLHYEGDAAPVEVAAIEVPAPVFREASQDFDALLRDIGGDAGNDGDAELAGAPVAVAATPKPDFANLSLEALTDAPAAAAQRVDEAPVDAKFQHNLSDLERRISSLSLIGEGDATTAPAVDAASGAVLILAGIGGPDAVRQILTALPETFRPAVLISQRLDGGRYDRLVQQMARASSLPVHLAEPNAQVQAGHVYIVPPEIGLIADGGMRFEAQSSLLEALPAEDSAVLLLSGADPAHVDIALAHAARGALVAGQSPDGCYDAVAPMALTARGGFAGAPQELVQSLLQRWPA